MSEREQDRPDAKGGAGGEAGAPRAELETLFERWEQGGLDAAVAPDDPELARASRAWRFDPFRLWVTLTVLVCSVAGWFMFLTRHEVAYWLQRDQPPAELGDLSERWRAGEAALGATSNRYVHASGLFVTHESEGQGEAGSDAEARRYFLCPLYDVVVRTTQPFPDKPYHRAAGIEVDPAFLPLLEDRRAFPYDLTVTVEVTGRLLRAEDAPRWHARPIRYFAGITGKDPRDLWLLIEGDAPSGYGAFAFIWGLGVAMMLVSVALLARAWRRRRA